MFVENQMTLVVHSVKQSAMYIAKIKKNTSIHQELIQRRCENMGQINYFGIYKVT